MSVSITNSSPDLAAIISGGPELAKRMRAFEEARASAQARCWRRLKAPREI